MVQAVEGKKKEVHKLVKQVRTAEEKIASLPTGRRRNTWTSKLENLRRLSIENAASREEIEGCTEFMEQLCLTMQTKEYLEKVLKGHQRESTRVLISCMKEHGVDQQIYHNGSIDGDHCMLLAQRAEKILKEVRRRMLRTIKNPENVDALTKTVSALTEIFNLWFELMKVMKSVRAQSEETIKNSNQTQWLSKEPFAIC